MIVAIVLQRLLPDQLPRPLPLWLLPILEGGVLVALTIANPVQDRAAVGHRALGQHLLILLISGPTPRQRCWLIQEIMNGHARSTSDAARCWPPAPPSGPPT